LKRAPQSRRRGPAPRIRAYGALLCAGVGLLVAALGATAEGAASHTVILRNIAFSPRTLKIHRGDVVRWVWRDGTVPHNVSARSFHSAIQSKGSFSVRFTRRGSFSYVCTLHRGMTGRIVVE
jgi:plastocyanin